MDELLKIQRRRQAFQAYRPSSVAPDFPKTVLVEISSLCNHACVFCAYTKTTREPQQIDMPLLDRLLVEAHALGAVEAGFYSGAEPFTSPNLERIILRAKEIGYEYVFISTNGSLATEKRLRGCIDNGLDSIKFSINAGDRETYKFIHGKDHFDRVLASVRYANEYRRAQGKRVYLAVSFVVIDEPGCSNAGTGEALKRELEGIVDEFVFIQALNQSGQTVGLAPNGIEPPCVLPFARVHISAEGYLRMCCNDYQNYLTLVDLNQTTLEASWQAPIFQEMRQRHLDKKLEGTLCHNCMYGVNTPIEPLVTPLSVPVPATFFDFQPRERTNR
jgi:molybdenum cofactor biosynthesis enzyme MoaA